MIAPNGLYHKNMVLPSGTRQVFNGDLKLNYSGHAIDRSTGKAIPNLPSLIKLDEKSDIVEVEVNSGRVTKGVIRMNYDGGNDLVLVLERPEASQSRVRTVWVNSKTDKHRTLNHSNYRRGRDLQVS